VRKIKAVFDSLLLSPRVWRIEFFAALVVFLCFLSGFIFKNNHVGCKIRNREERRMKW
jgi:hypothetical protein